MEIHGRFTRRACLGAWCAALFLVVCPRFSPANETIAITAASGTHHVFEGFGISTVHHWQNESSWWANLSQAKRDEYVKMLFDPPGAGGFEIIRIWSGLEYNNSAAALASRHKLYVSDVRRVNPDVTLLFAPCAASASHIGNLQGYASSYAQQMKAFKDAGIGVHVTGICNEPDVGDRLKPEDTPQLIKYFRTELDNRGLGDVKIIAPENATVDVELYAHIESTRNDPNAMDALYGWGSHSYNCGATFRVWELTHETGKTYWQTESSNVSSCGTNDDDVASRAAATILGDINNVVTHWVYFIDFYNATGMGLFVKGSGGATPMLQYFYMRQISEAIHAGAHMRFCISDKELPRREMTWEYGRKSAVYAAAAANPDGTWGFGVCNATGMSSGSPHLSFYPAATYDVTVHAEELAGLPEITFRLFKCSNSARIQAQPEKIIMRDGSFTITVRPRELFTLRSEEPITVSAQRQALQTAPAGDGAFEIICRATFSSPLRIGFEIPASEGARLTPVRLTVYDLGGRMVSKPVENDMAAGRHSVAWDGSGRTGRRLPAGTYVIRMECGGLASALMTFVN